MEPAEFRSLYYGNLGPQGGVIILSGGTRRVVDAAFNFDRVETDASPHIRAVAEALRTGRAYPPLIAVESGVGDLILVEGYTRATAYAIVGPPGPVGFFIGIVWASRALPVAVEGHWREWLGSFRSDEIARTNFVLVAILPSKNPQVLDAENQQLTQTPDYSLYGLLLQGVPYYDKGFSLSGANVNTEIQIRQFSELLVLLCH